MKYSEMSKSELESELEALKEEYQGYKQMGLSLTMARGNPCKEQLELSNGLYDTVNGSNAYTQDGLDVRNYGGLDGIPEMKRLFAQIFECPERDIIIGENSSLHMMFDAIAQAVSMGLDGEQPWATLDKVKFLCPAPGYDRHFAVTQYFGIENITVPMTENGPDMDVVEELVKDPAVKGIWCVPKYSNPDGITYSDDTVRRLASMRPAAKDFRIIWDNAYLLHHIYEQPEKQEKVLCLYKECQKFGTQNRVLMFASFSKITHPGSGVAAMAASDHNIELIKHRMTFQTIGPDKVNQLRHCRFFKDIDAVREHMMKHAAIVRPKFELVLNTLKKELSAVDCSWRNPKGGYFVSFYAPKGCAKKIVALCKDAGLILTPAGATYPYGNDPDDSNIRIAPTFPPITELETALKLFTVAVKIAAIEKIL